MVDNVDERERRAFDFFLKISLGSLSRSTELSSETEAILNELHETYNTIPHAHSDLRTHFISEVVRCGRELCGGQLTDARAALLAELMKILHEIDLVLAAVIKGVYEDDLRKRNASSEETILAAVAMGV
jgi:uridylate kinase